MISPFCVIVGGFFEPAMKFVIDVLELTAKNG